MTLAQEQILMILDPELIYLMLALELIVLALELIVLAQELLYLWC